MAVLSSQHLGIALHPPSLSLSTNVSTPIPPLLRCHCSSSLEVVRHCSFSFGIARLGARFRAYNQNRGLQRARVVVSDAATKQSQADGDAVDYEAAEALTMCIKMEGTLTDTNLSSIVKTLEGMEGVSNVKVSLEEGKATVELTKRTTVQATGVASELVDAVQEVGFKMQSLCLGFDDEETSEDDALYFGSSSAMDEEEIAAI